MYGYNPFLQNYQQNYQNNMGNAVQQNNLQQDERIYVSNQQAAEAYIVAANGFVRLWDSSQPRFYEKSADYTGRPLQMKVYEYKEVSPMQQTPNENYVTSDEFIEFRNKVNDFINSFEDSEVE